MGFGPSRVAGPTASELWLNTDWRNENRSSWSVREKAVDRMGVYALDCQVLSLAFLNSGLLATNGATLGACTVSV